MPRPNPTQRRGKRPHLPFKLAVTLLYGHVPGVKRLGDGRLLVTTRELAKYLTSSNQDLVRRFKVLEEWGLLAELEIDKHTILVTLLPPIDWRKDLDDE